MFNLRKYEPFNTDVINEFFEYCNNKIKLNKEQKDICDMYKSNPNFLCYSGERRVGKSTMVVLIALYKREILKKDSIIFVPNSGMKKCIIDIFYNFGYGDILKNIKVEIYNKNKSLTGLHDTSIIFDEVEFDLDAVVRCGGIYSLRT